MSAVFKTFLSMSFSGGLLILVLLLSKRFLKDKISRQWQYYIWIIVILRLLLPFGPEINLMGGAYRAADAALTFSTLQPQLPPVNTQGNSHNPADGPERDDESAGSPAQAAADARPLENIGALLTEHAWLIWLVAALALLIRKVTIYQGFVRYISAGLTPVSDIEILDRLSAAAERAGVRRPVELCVNPLISSPMLIGFFHPCIVLPCADIPKTNFEYIVLHELTHCKRRDMLYKWLVQITVCLHWFNPLVYLLSREITKACEFSCDEAVLAKTGYGGAQDYGKTLLDAMAAVGKYRENFGAVTLSENKQLLKERLGAIMGFKKKTKATRALTVMLTLCVILGAAFVGVYSVEAADAPNRADSGKALPSRSDNSARPKEAKRDIQQDHGEGESLSETERYYEAGSLPLFEIAFSRLDENAQRTWLDKLYAADDFAFFSAAVHGLDADSSLPAGLSEKAYNDGEIALFSILTDRMDQTQLEAWLDRALEDCKWNFQSMLFDKLDRRDEFDKLEEKREKEWEEAQKAEYLTAGVTMDGKNYYYQGQLVNIFLDIRNEGSFYVLDMNPKGTVNVKIIRDSDDKITGAACMTDAEVMSLLGDI